MKKILNIILILMMMICISACKKEETIKKEVIEEEPMIEIKENKDKEELLGGWTVYEAEPNPQTSEEGMQVMEAALENEKDVSYRPFIELGTQLVSGKNYMYLAYKYDNTNTPSTSLVIISAYKNMQGDVKLLHINPLNILSLAGAKQNDDAVETWKVNENLVKVDLPETVQKTFDNATKDLLGASYEPLALLASQVIAGERFAILAKQTMISAKPTTNLVIMFIQSNIDKTNTIENIYTLNLADFNK